MGAPHLVSPPQRQAAEAVFLNFRKTKVSQLYLKSQMYLYSETVYLYLMYVSVQCTGVPVPEVPAISGPLRSVQAPAGAY